MRLDFFNDWHLGDNVLHLHYLRKIANNGINSNYYVMQEYIDELSHHLSGYENNVNLLPRHEAPVDAINAWIGSDNFYHKDAKSWDYTNFYIDWFNHLSEKAGIENPVKSMLCDYDNILKYKSEPYDILLINSDGYSSGIAFGQEPYVDFIKRHQDKYRIITTKKIEGVPCTQDTGMNLVQIANLSLNIKHLVTVFTSPCIMCFNIWNIDNLETIHIFDARNRFTFRNDIQFHTDLQELYGVTL